MRRLLLVVLLVLGLLPAAALADPLAGPVRVVEQAQADLHSRTDSPAAREAAVQEYLRSDTHRRLALQYALGNDVPFRHATWLGTHNSFNNTTRDPTLSGLDSNQQLSMTDQLRLDMRTLEVDAHWFPSVAAGGYGPVACHARGQDQQHAGCTTEALLGDVLRELATWLRANPGQVLLLYLEDHLDTDQGYAAGAEAVRSALGPLLYAPGGTRCTPLPLDRTRNDVLRARKQVLVISGCHSGAGWNGTVFSGEARARDETGPGGYGPSRCDPARPPAVYDDHLLRVFEDSTALTATTAQGADRISPTQAAAFQRCAVDITGFDQLEPSDPRLTASIWSWARSQPADGRCAVMTADGFHSAPCSVRAPQACRTPAGWTVVAHCVAPGTPRYGWEAAQLLAAMKQLRVSSARLAMTLERGRWTAHDHAR